MTFLPWQLYSLVVMFGICIGVYLCHQTAKDMGVHDHGSIVWDEFIGMWITLMALPTTDWQWVAAGFVIFPHSGYVETLADPLVLIATCTAAWGL
ncbi:phosphatidylglycerophosphatase A [Salmonella enterica subsp. enterica serovar Daytona]|uniref:Phosphatidylglycerophosphatase A n=1 Tax=Salmonella enterica subsp. enterica serovar Daytona TaxID=1962639 RepID=A0A447JMA6_SALET|nr:phosphatidylglycerophosphatase A [Salmonella enterica subsp. enterica serovar Daytona]